jgi:serine phosphatase RsbU (regulator of sigma subunit)
VGQANTILEGASVSSMYTTLIIGWYEAGSGRLRYVCAGNTPGYRVDPDGGVTPFGEVTGPPVGLLPGRTFEERIEQLAPGDCVVWFTDGVPEAEGPGDEFYGDERLQALLSELGGRGAGDTCRIVAERIAEYEQGSPHDDVTLLAIRRR